MHKISCEYATTAEVASYYDDTLPLRLRDYVFNNERIAKAVALASSTVASNTRKVLDVGCGLGIAAAQLAESHPTLMVHGVDISSKTIAAAQRLFGSNRLVFECSAMQDVPHHAPYDLITLLDVYEHIPRQTWPDFNSVLDRALSKHGTIVVTTPSPAYQEYLRQYKPQSLQIIDESVTPEDFVAIAQAVHGVLVEFRTVSIWRENDYSHAVIRRGVNCGEIPPLAPITFTKRFIRKVKSMVCRSANHRQIQSRRKRVHDKLGIELGNHR